MKQTRQAVPFETQNEAIAFTLFKCGCKLLAVRNTYTAEMLRKLGFATVRDAWKKKARGAVTYVFEPSDDLTAILDGWSDGETNRDEQGAYIEGCTPREFGHIAQNLLTGRSEFGKLWEFQTPRFRQENGPASVAKDGDGNDVLTSPGFRECSIDAPDHIKRKLGFIK